MDILISIGIGVFASLAASILWLFILSKIKPNITISTTISKTLDTDGKQIYKIKIINKGPRPIVNIKAKLYIITPRYVPSGQILVTKPIILKSEEILGLPEFNLKDKEAKYAFRFITYENLESIWNNDNSQHICLKIYAQDSLSSLGKFFEQKYYMKRNCLIDGEFSYGNSFDIK